MLKLKNNYPSPLHSVIAYHNANDYNNDEKKSSDILTKSAFTDGNHLAAGASQLEQV